jgi:hypothetical protein
MQHNLSRRFFISFLKSAKSIKSNRLRTFVMKIGIRVNPACGILPG